MVEYTLSDSGDNITHSQIVEYNNDGNMLVQNLTWEDLYRHNLRRAQRYQDSVGYAQSGSYANSTTYTLTTEERELWSEAIYRQRRRERERIALVTGVQTANEQAPNEDEKQEKLSLIHISEPTRPY